MKNIKIWKLNFNIKNLMIGYIFIIICLSFTNCRKDRGSISPVNPVGPEDPYSTNENPVIQEQTVCMLEPNSGNNSFIPGFIVETGQSLSEQPANPPEVSIPTVLKIIAKIMSVKENMTKKKDFKDLTNKVNNLIAMESQVLQSIQDLQNQLKLTQVEILNYIANLTVNTYITSIETAYSTTSPQGLLYFSQYARDIQDGIRPESDTNLLRSQAQVYLSAIYEQHSPDIINLISQIHTQVCPVTGGTTQSVLNQYCNHILLDPASNFNNQEVRKPENIMKSYLLLENYFMHLINAQYKGLIIMGNIYNQIDTSGYTYRSYLQGTFKTFMLEETSMFMLMADRLAVNLVDYRTLDVFSNAVKSLESGLAVDDFHRNMLARSRFISGIILQAIGLEPIGYGSTVLVPARYNSSHSLNPGTLSMQHNGTAVQAIVDQYNSVNGIPGVFPYTMWTDASTIAPDNLWYVYSATVPESQVKPGDNQVGISPLPWSGTGLVSKNSLSGSYKALYYNPRNPDPNTATAYPTYDNTYLFGFTALSWVYGDLITCIPATNSVRYPFTGRVEQAIRSRGNPLSEYIPGRSSGQWKDAGFTPYYHPSPGSNEDRICYTCFDPQGQVNPIPVGFKMRLANGTSTDINVSPGLSGSPIQFYFLTNTFAKNITGSGNTPCKYQVVLFYGGTGNFGSYDNSPANLFYKESWDLAAGAWDQIKSISGPSISPGTNRFSFTWELGINGAATKPKAYENFLPMIKMEIFGQVVYQGTYNIFQ